MADKDFDFSKMLSTPKGEDEEKPKEKKRGGRKKHKKDGRKKVGKARQEEIAGKAKGKPAKAADVTDSTKESDEPKKPVPEQGGKERESDYVEVMSFNLYPEYKEMIQAVAWYERIPQREVLERALNAYFDGKESALKKAIREFRDK